MLPDDSLGPLDILHQRGLLETTQLDQIRRELGPAADDPRALANELVRRGWLTGPQAEEFIAVPCPGLPSMIGFYKVVDMIGQGGMGTVYRAVHTRLRRPVALKVLRRDRIPDAQAVARFQREIEAVGRLDHPNVVRATDAGEADGLYYLVMELVDGPDLSCLVRDRGPLRVADACELARQVAVGLECIHDHHLVHRDIKPSNLLLSASGVVKIVDLGLASLRRNDPADSGLTGAGQLMGTLDYMAPEQAEDPHAADIRADIYSLGCTLYYLLAGRAPFRGEGWLAKIRAHQETEPEPLESLRPDLSRGLQAVVRRAMAKLPADRFQTPGELAGALEPFCRGADVAGIMLLATLAPPADSLVTGLPRTSPTVIAGPPAHPRLGFPRAAAWVALALYLAGVGYLAVNFASGSGPPGEERPSVPAPILVAAALPPVAVLIAAVVLGLRRWALGPAVAASRTAPAAPTWSPPVVEPRAVEADGHPVGSGAPHSAAGGGGHEPPGAAPRESTLMESTKRRGRAACPHCGVLLTPAQVGKRRELGFDWLSCPVCGQRVEMPRPLQDEVAQLRQRCQTMQAQIEELKALGLSVSRAPGQPGPAPDTEARQAAETLLQGKIARGEFDTFLAHNAKDKALVEVVAGKLKERGLYPWLDREQIPPGRSFQDEIQKALPAVRSMTVFLGPAGVGPWEAWELRVMISQCVETGKPVIPVLLPGVSGFPPNLLFLKEMTGVAFREHVEEAEPLAHLVWGITGVRPPG